MTVTQAIRSVLSQRTSAAGRACRSEFWWWMVFALLSNVFIALLDRAIFGPMAGSGPLSALFVPLTMLASLSLSIRRLHDIDRDGRWLWLSLVPVIGWAVTIHWAATRGTPGPNRFGPDPIPA